MKYYKYKKITEKVPPSLAMTIILKFLKKFFKSIKKFYKFKKKEYQESEKVPSTKSFKKKHINEVSKI